jgi:tetratricopeptide (TPR) repeat protein
VIDQDDVEKKLHQSIPHNSLSMNALKSDSTILLTAIVSTYNAAEFIHGCLEDLVNQTIADRMEIIVVDSASQQDEIAVVKDFQNRYPNIKYIRTPVRESVYQAWNRGIKLASGKYITNANTDDRHRQDTFEQMVRVMEKDEKIALVYADVIKTRTPNQTFDQCTPTGMFRWYDWDRKTLLEKGCFIGPQPVWRKNVHEEYGYFDQRYEVSSDFEFWLRISQTNDFYHIPKPLGLYLERRDSVEHANYEKKVREDTQILQCYRNADKKNIRIGVASKVKNGNNGGDRLVEEKNGMADGKPNMVKLFANEKTYQGEHPMESPAMILKAIEHLINGGMQEAAYWAMGKLVLDFPDNAQIHNEMALLAYQQGDMDNAQTHFHEAVQLAPHKIDYLKSYGDFCYVVKKDAESALAQYETILRIDPDHIEALVMAGHVSISLQHYSDAQQFYENVLRLNPDHQEVRSLLEGIKNANPQPTACDMSVDDLYDAARVKIQEGDRAAAISLLEQLVALDDDHGPAHNDLGVLNYENKNMEAALTHYQKAADLTPENDTFQKNLADFYWYEMRDHHQALARYVQTLKLNSNDVEAQLGCSQICLSLGKEEDARELIHSALQIEPWNENARLLFSQLEGGAGEAKRIEGEKEPHRRFPEKASLNENAEAIDELTRQLAQSPNDAMLHNNLGVLQYEAGEKDKALASYEQAVRLEPTEPNYLKNLADFYMIEQGRSEDAMKLYLEVLAQNPRDVDALNATGMVCTVLSKTNDARYFYERVLEIEPWNENAANGLKHISNVTAEETSNKENNCIAG